MLKNPFAAPWEIFQNAQTHINRFLVERAAFLSDPKHAHVVDKDSHPGNQLHKIRFSEPIPFRLNSIALDAVTNLRDALDNAVTAAIRASGVPIRRPKKIKFPFGDGRGGVQGEIDAALDIHPDIASLLIGSKPEARADNSLWTLNYLANSKKHRWNLEPFPMMAGNISMHINFLATPGFPQLLRIWDPEKNELTYLNLPSGAHGNFYTRVAADIAFNEPETVKQKSALSTLRLFSEETKGILTGIEAECRRLGWRV